MAPMPLVAQRLARRRAGARHLLAVPERVVGAEGPFVAARAGSRRRQPRLARRPDRDRVRGVLALVGAAVGRCARQGREIEVERLGPELAARDHPRTGLTLAGEDDELVLVVQER